MNNLSLIIGGPTSSGKTALSVALSLELERKRGITSEIINADSVQMYYDLKILTAYPSEEELSKVKHSLFGILSPYESSSAVSWLKLAKNEINRIHNEEKIAIICGGTGFYIKALLEGISEIPAIPEEFRKEIQEHFDRVGREKFFEELSELDEISAKTLHKNDTQRILRAYEVAYYTGKSLSEWWKSSKSKINADISFNIPAIVLLPEKEIMRNRSKLHIAKMLEEESIEEVRNFLIKYSDYKGPLTEVIGYCEICDFINQKITNKNELCEKIYVRTKRYIKRQSTWFRNKLKNAKFICGVGNDKNTLNEALLYVSHFLGN